MSDVVLQYPITVQQTIQIYRGDASVPIKLLLTGPSGPIPLDGFGDTWECQLKVAPDAGVAAEFIVDDTHVADGYVTLESLSGEDTAALRAGEAYGADVQASGGTLSPFTVWRLAFYVEGDYTT